MVGNASRAINPNIPPLLYPDYILLSNNLYLRFVTACLFTPPPTYFQHVGTPILPPAVRPSIFAIKQSREYALLL
jgi:hypothetical protein